MNVLSTTESYRVFAFLSSRFAFEGRLITALEVSFAALSAADFVVDPVFELPGPGHHAADPNAGCVCKTRTPTSSEVGPPDGRPCPHLAGEHHRKA